MFEWFVSPNLKDITNVLIKIASNTDNDIIKYVNNHIYINDVIFSSHYNYDQFQSIYTRRRDRFVDRIQKSSRLLFCRVEQTYNEYVKEDIDNFIDSIKNIHPTIEDIKVLLIGPTQLKFEHPSFIHVFYGINEADPYYKSKEINDLFVNTLQLLGYNVSETTDISFTDTSEL